MRIKALTLHAFGRFSNKTLTFGEGLNIIEGKNEAGKSTIHTFIEGMFYGFFKPYIKNRGYTSKYEQYMPWLYDGYGGSLMIEDGGKVLRLERTFTKGKDRLAIYNHETGEDITDTYGYNKVTRLVEPGKKHLGLSQVMYRNTLGLIQQGSQTEKDLIKEIKDNMSNLGSAHSTTLSIERVLERIRTRRDAIGSNRKKASVYYHLTEEIKKLEARLVEIKEAEVIVANLKKEEDYYAKAIEENKQKRATYTLKIAYLDREKKRTILEKIKNLEVEEATLENRLKMNEQFATFNTEEMVQLRDTYNVLARLREQKNQLVDWQKKNKKILVSWQERKKEKKDIKKLEEKYKQINQIMRAYEEEEKKIEIKKQEYTYIKRQKIGADIKGKPSYGMGILGILSIIFLMTFYMGRQSLIHVAKQSEDVILGQSEKSMSLIPLGVILASIIGILILVGMAMTVIIKRKQQYDYKQACIKVDRLLEQMENIEQEIISREHRLEKWLIGEGVISFYELREKRDRLLEEQSMAKQFNKEQENIEQKVQSIKEGIHQQEKEIEQVEVDSKNIQEKQMRSLNTFGIFSKEEIQSSHERYKHYKEDLAEQKQLRLRKEELLAGESLESLKETVQQKLEIEVEKEATREILEVALDTIRTEQLSLVERRGEISSKKQEEEKVAGEKAEVEEAIEQSKKQQKIYDRKLEINEKMYRIIEVIAEETQNNFAPELNKVLSSVIETVSQGKYKDIKVNPDMVLTVVDTNAHKTVRATDLSSGTIDMFYLGLRLGIVQVVTQGKNVPLILDDAFSQYDDARLGATLSLLMRQHRQVLLFTCHTRESTYLKQAGLKHNLIKLEG